MNGTVFDFSVGHSQVEKGDILNIRGYLMKENNKKMFQIFEKAFIALFIALSLSGPLATKCISLNNQPSLARHTLTYFNPDELHHHLFNVTLDRSDGSCNTISDLFGR